MSVCRFIQHVGTITGQIVSKFAIDIHSPQEIIPQF